LNTSVDRVAPRRGRPRKFSAPSRAVTLTLPENVLAALEAIDPDVSRAVVRLAQPEMKKRPRAPAELALFGRRAVIVVNASRTLEQRTGVILVPLSDGRALISFDESLTPARLELRIQDALDGEVLPPHDARIFEAIADILKTARRSGAVTVMQRNIIVLESISPVRARLRVPTRKHRRQKMEDK
jgi:hypothetical protein